MKLVPSYIHKLDDILEGGFYKPSVVLVAGSAGSGKTTFAAQSLFNAARAGETCLFISTLSESPAMINSYMSRFSFFDQTLGYCNILIIPLFSLEYEIFLQTTFLIPPAVLIFSLSVP